MTKSIRANSLLALLISSIIAIALFLPALAGAQQEENQRGRSAEVTEKIESRKSAALEAVAQKRESAQEKSSEARTNACEKRQAKITNAMSRISTQADKHVTVFDNIYARVQGFYDKGQLTVENYDELNTAVTEAQAAAALEVSVLSELNVEVDCENPDVASTVATYRGSAQSAKEALKTYRTALVDLISSLKAEAAQQSGDTDDSQDGSTSEAETETEEESEAPEAEVEEAPETESEN